MDILTKLITKDTDIILLTNENITLKDKYEILGYTSVLADYYVSYIYKNNNNIYYFKEQSKNRDYPFALIEELMGTYLCNYLNLKSIKYSVATNGCKYGLASLNFKDDQHKYYFFNDFINKESIENGLYNLNVLRYLCINEDNYEELIKQIMDLIVLDIYMVQCDRSNINIQFQIDKKTKYLSLAPIYDFSNCSFKFNSDIQVCNAILQINQKNIIKLLKNSKYFKERINYILENDMSKIWKQICIDYKLNQECSTYENINDYYKSKYNSQKKYIKQLIKDVQL